MPWVPITCDLKSEFRPSPPSNKFAREPSFILFPHFPTPPKLDAHQLQAITSDFSLLPSQSFATEDSFLSHHPPSFPTRPPSHLHVEVGDASEGGAERCVCAAKVADDEGCLDVNSCVWWGMGVVRGRGMEG